MKITFVVVGKTDAAWVNDGIAKYVGRIGHYIPFEMTVIPDIRKSGNLSEIQQKKKEGELILKILQPGDQVVLLDDKGQNFTSLGFADYIEKKMHTVTKRLVFVVGGPYGFSDDIYNAAAEKISLSRMTFSHQLVRVVFLEQLYRAMTILRNEPYHHE